MPQRALPRSILQTEAVVLLTMFIQLVFSVFRAGTFKLEAKYNLLYFKLKYMETIEFRNRNVYGNSSFVCISNHYIISC